MCALAGIAYTAIAVRRACRQTHYRPIFEDWIWYSVLPGSMYATLMLGAISLQGIPQIAPFLVAGAALGLLFIGIRNAWDTVTYVVVSGDSKRHNSVNMTNLNESLDDRPAFRYYDILSVLGATVAVCTNMLVLKVARIGPFTFGGAVVFFPITYILGDVLTEVYGFRRARRVIWLSFGAQLYAAAMSWAVLAMPPDPGKLEIQRHYEAVFSATPRFSPHHYWPSLSANS